MEGPAIKFSLVVATVERSHQLTRLLESLKAQTYQKFEVILVDQNPPGFLTGIVAPFEACFPILHLRSKLGASLARNVGLGHITGQAVGFPDDDCWYPPDVLERIADLLTKHPEWSGLTGRPADPGIPDSFPWYHRTSGAVDLMNLWRRSICISIFLRREVVEAVGGFDENLGPGASTGMFSAEESEYLIRVLKRGYQLHYCADVSFYHAALPPKNVELRIPRALGEGRGFGYILRKYKYPLIFVVHTWIRALGGAAQSLLYGNRTRAQYYWAQFRGRLMGWFVDSRRSDGVGRKSAETEAQHEERRLESGEGTKSSQPAGMYGGAYERRKIRVLFVMSDLAGGGTERSLLELLGRLDRRRIEPSLLLLKREGANLNRVPAGIEFSWVCEGGSRLWHHMPAVLLSALRHGAHADVIVGAMETTPTYVAWLAASVLRRPLVGWVRMDLDEYLASVPAWHRRAARWIYPRCAAVVTPSGGSERSLRRVASVASAKLHLIHNPVDTEEVKAMASELLPPGMESLLAKRFILGAGRLHNFHKGFDLLVRAHAAVRRRGIEHNLIILGEGADRALLQQLALSLDVEDSVFMPGFQSNPFPFFRAATALAAPARMDSFGRIYLEAMALGLPVIGSTASGPAEILQDGEYGITVPSEDVEALSDAMYLLLADAGMHARYSQRSLERVCDYGPEHIASQWDDLLCGLAMPEQNGRS
jgi:glycosyltransferase involved in cell wall biosynthesis